MFIDEMFEDLLFERRMNYADAMPIVYKEKFLTPGSRTFTTIKRIENAYQLFRSRHPEFTECAFRRFIAMREPSIAEKLGWEKFTVK